MGTIAAPIDTRPSARLRRICAAALAGDPLGDGDGRWLAAGLSVYLDGAAGGTTLDDALGVAAAPGARAWWTVEAVEHRDEIVRTIAARHFGDLRGRAQAEAIAMAAEKYARNGLATGRRRDCTHDGADAGLESLLGQWQATDQPFPIGARRVRQILTSTELSISGNGLGGK